MNEERTKDIYEIIDNYQQPPLIPQSAFDINRSLKNVNVNLINKIIFKSFFFLSGYKKFQKNILQHIERILKTTEFKSGALFAPVVSATLAIKDDSRDITPIERAATLIVAARKFYGELMSGKLPPDKYEQQILEMGQYPNLFSTTQIINNGKVSLFKSKKISQITVIFNGRYFLVSLDEPEENLSVKKIKDLLNEIVNNTKAQNTDYNSPGLLTCAKNKTQIKIFQEFSNIDINKKALNKIKHSFLTLCLDLNFLPKSDAESARIAHVGNYQNRWYHSSLQIVIFGNSKTSFICNFSNSISGNVMMRAGAEIQKRALDVIVDDHEVYSKKIFSIDELKWKVKNEWLNIAEKDVKPIMDDQESTFEINSIGRNYFYSQNIKSIPAFIIALQMTIKKLTGNNLKITQFLAMSKYRYMDLTTTVVTTPEVLKFTDIVQNNSTKKQLTYYFNQAIVSQINKIKNARSSLHILGICMLFIKSLKGFRLTYVKGLFVITNIMLRLSKFFKNNAREVIVSHPKIYDEVTIVGRPGIKIPYVKNFGLHYQIFEEKIVITMMPGLKWKIPNKQFVEELEKQLLKIKSFLG